MGFVAFTSALPDCWLLFRESDNLADRYLCLIPFKNQCAVWPQNPKCLIETGSDIITPALLIQRTVLFPHPTVLSSAVQVGWIKHHLCEAAVRER